MAMIATACSLTGLSFTHLSYDSGALPAHSRSSSANNNLKTRNIRTQPATTAVHDIPQPQLRLL